MGSSDSNPDCCFHSSTASFAPGRYHQNVFILLLRHGLWTLFFLFMLYITLARKDWCKTIGQVSIRSYPDETSSYSATRAKQLLYEVFLTLNLTCLLHEFDIFCIFYVGLNFSETL